MTYNIPGSIIDKATSAANEAKAAIEKAKPSFDSMLAAVKDGSIFKDVKAQLSSLSEGGIDTSEASKAIEAAKKNAMVDIAIAKAALNQKIKEATARGETIKQEEVDAAMAPTSVLTGMQTLLKNATSKMSEIQATVGKAVSAGAASISGIASSATGEVSDSLNGLVNKAPALMQEAQAALNKSLSTDFTSLAAKASDAKAEALSSLKADAFLSMLSKPMPTRLASVVTSSIDQSKIDKFAIVKAQETQVTQPVPGQEKAPDEVRPNPAPKMPTGEESQPALKSDVNTTIWSKEVSGFSKKVDELKAAWYSLFGAVEGDPQSVVDQKGKVFVSSLLTADEMDIWTKGRAIKDTKPNALERTDEEKAIMTQYTDVMNRLRSKPKWIEYKAKYVEYVEKNDRYKQVYNTWINNGSRFSLPSNLEQELKTYA